MRASIEVDLTKASEATGANETYYAGSVEVDGTVMNLDGTTDRSSDDWAFLVENAILAAFDVTAEEVDDELSLSEQIAARMSLGRKYRVDSVDDENYFGFEISDITPDTEPTIWRVHAERIAEDIVERLCQDFVMRYREGHLRPNQTLREYLMQVVVLKISETLEMREDE